MATPDWLDYSFSRPTSLKLLTDAGIRGVSRYLSEPDNPKNLTADEARDLLDAGLGVILNWESDAGRPLLGADAGRADGRDAAAYAESIGAPHGLTIYYSCDRDTGPAQWPNVRAYYKAAAQATAGRYLVGAYAEADVIDDLYDRGLITSCWQTYAWSGGRETTNADLLQYNNGQTMAGATVDYNRVIRAARLGAWWPAGHRPEGDGTQIGEDDMTDEQFAQHIAAINSLGDRFVQVVTDAVTTLSGHINDVRDEVARADSGGPIVPGTPVPGNVQSLTEALQGVVFRTVVEGA